jgi:acyl carrier protein
MTVSERVCLLMSEQGCGVFPIREIQVEQRLYDLGFDSLRYMELVVLLEETFNIAFPDEMLEISSQTTVKEIVETVESCMKSEEE